MGNASLAVGLDDDLVAHTDNGPDHLCGASLEGVGELTDRLARQHAAQHDPLHFNTA